VVGVGKGRTRAMASAKRASKSMAARAGCMARETWL
jgi:hypothetical protein